MGEPVRVEGCRLPLGQARYTLEVPAGRTLAEIVRQAAGDGPAAVQINGEPVPEALWPKVRCKGGVTVSVAPVAGDLVTVLVAIGAAVAGAAIVFLLPQPGASDDVERQRRIEGGSNRVHPYGPMPVAFGRLRYAPPAVNAWIPYKGPRPGAAPPSVPLPFGQGAWQPVAAADDDRQWVRTMLMWCLGAADVSDIRLDQTPAADFGDSVRLATGADALTDFPKAVRKVDLGADLNGAATLKRRIGRVETACTVILQWPQGLYRVNNKGEIHGFDAASEAAKRPVGLRIRLLALDGTALATADVSAEGGSNVAPRYEEHVLAAPSAQECVLEVRRDRAARQSLKANDDLTVHACVIPLSRAPVSVSATLTSVRVEATDQISGRVPTISGVVQARHPDWDADAEAWPVGPTRNPASAFRAVLMGAGNARPLAASRVWGERLQSWHEWCAAEGWTYDRAVLRQTSVDDMLKEIAAAGRASPVWIDGLRGVAMDRRQGARTQVFTPANSAGFSAKRAAKPVPHALRCRFRDEDHGYAQAEVRVYRPGYTASTATLVEERRLPGQTVRNTVAAHLAYQLRAEAARREEYSLEVDWEHLVVEQGGRVGLMHDALHDRAWAGTALSAVSDGADAALVRLDLRLGLRPRIDYWAVVRPPTGDPATYVAERTGDADTVRLRGSGALPDVTAGDLVTVGQAGTGMADCVLVGVDDAGDARARLTLAAYGGEDVFAAQAGYTVEHVTPGGMVEDVPFGARELARLRDQPLRTVQTVFASGDEAPDPPSGDAIAPPWGGTAAPGSNWQVSRAVEAYPLVADPPPPTYTLAGLTIPVGSEVDYGPWGEVTRAPSFLERLSMRVEDKDHQSLRVAAPRPAVAPDSYSVSIFKGTSQSALETLTPAGDANGFEALFDGLDQHARYRIEGRAVHDGGDDGPTDVLYAYTAALDGLTLRATGTTTATAEAPDAGAGTNYHWQIDQGRSPQLDWRDAGTTSVPRRDFTGLTPNSQHNVRYRAGSGPWSTVASAFTRQQADAPGIPGGITLSITPDGVPKAAFTEPKLAAGHSIRHYGVRLMYEGVPIQRLPGPGTERTFQPVFAPGVYSLQMRAVSVDAGDVQHFGDTVDAAFVNFGGLAVGHFIGGWSLRLTRSEESTPNTRAELRSDHAYHIGTGADTAAYDDLASATEISLGAPKNDNPITHADPGYAALKTYFGPTSRWETVYVMWDPALSTGLPDPRTNQYWVLYAIRSLTFSDGAESEHGIMTMEVAMVAASHPERENPATGDNLVGFAFSGTAPPVLAETMPEPAGRIANEIDEIEEGGAHQFKAEGVTPGATVSWEASAGTIDDDGNWTAPTVSSDTDVTVSLLVDGTAVVTLTITVKDSGGTTVTPPPKKTLTVAISGLPASLREDTSALLSAKVGGTASGPVTYRWSCSPGTFGTTTTSAQARPRYRPPNVSANTTATVSLTVSRGGLSATASATTTVTPVANVAPVTITISGPSSLSVGDTADYDAVVTGGSGAQSSRTWGAALGIIAVGGRYTATRAGTETISFTVTIAGRSYSATKTVSVS